MKRGDIWWAEIPGDKRRPVLVLTRQRFIDRLDAVVVAPVTTTVRAIPTEVRLDVTDGMPRPCAANFDNVFTLRRGFFETFITHLDDATMADVCRACRFAVGC